MEEMEDINQTQLILVTTTTTGGGVLFHAGVLYSKRKQFLPNFGYFVANLRTFGILFTGPTLNSLFMTQNDKLKT